MRFKFLDLSANPALERSMLDEAMFSRSHSLPRSLSQPSTKGIGPRKRGGAETLKLNSL